MKSLCILICVCAVFVAVPGALHAADEAPPGGEVVARVGEVKITREMLDRLINTIPEDKQVPFRRPDGREKLLEEVIGFILFAEAAKAQGIDKEPAIKTRLEYLQQEYLAREYARRRMAAAPTVSEAELQAYYKEHIDEFKPPEEIKARHILTGTEAEANKVLEKIRAGDDFIELAKKHSIDPAATKGGVLELQDGREWLPKGSFEAGFEHELFKIPKGEVSKPIKSQFGWHILKVEDKRQPQTHSFIQMRSMIKQRLEDRKRIEMHKSISEEIKKTIPVEVR
jgi:peptidyl-prolyl cis-trans isomerase C